MKCFIIKKLSTKEENKLNYKPLKDAQAFTTSRWTDTLDAWKKAQDDKEVAYKAFLKNLTESHYYGYIEYEMNKSKKKSDFYKIITWIDNFEYVKIK